jgi:hypothetical protein
MRANLSVGMDSHDSVGTSNFIKWSYPKDRLRASGEYQSDLHEV